MAARPETAMTCPVCLDVMKKPIKQCKVGHSMCGDCITTNRVKKCPECRGPLTEARNYRLEELIEGVRNCLKLPCTYSHSGCKYTLTTQEKESHELECKYRIYYCEGLKFCKWKCDWYGKFEQIYQHFKDSHQRNTGMNYKTEATCRIKFNEDYCDLQIIPFFNGQQLFWYKHKVDHMKQMAYWTIQFIGPIHYAKHYYYEFEVYNGPINKFKVTQICENEIGNENDIFDAGKCVAMPFNVIKRFLNEIGELQFKFRIMIIKGSNTNTPISPTAVAVTPIFCNSYLLNNVSNRKPDNHRSRVIVNKSRKQNSNSIFLP